MYTPNKDAVIFFFWAMDISADSNRKSVSTQPAKTALSSPEETTWLTNSVFTAMTQQISWRKRVCFDCLMSTDVKRRIAATNAFQWAFLSFVWHSDVSWNVGKVMETTVMSNDVSNIERSLTRSNDWLWIYRSDSYAASWECDWLYAGSYLWP